MRASEWRSLVVWIAALTGCVAFWVAPIAGAMGSTAVSVGAVVVIGLCLLTVAGVVKIEDRANKKWAKR